MIDERKTSFGEKAAAQPDGSAAEDPPPGKVSFAEAPTVVTALELSEEEVEEEEAEEDLPWSLEPSEVAMVFWMF